MVTIIKEPSKASRDNITQYRNSQNSVKGKDLISLQTFHKGIRGQLKQVGYFYEIQAGSWKFEENKRQAQYTGNDIFKILGQTAEAIKFLQANAKKYNIDPNRISVMGSSAGAIISCHLGHGEKLSGASVYAHQQPRGTPRLTVPRLRKDGPPIVVYNRSGTNDRVHHPKNAAAVLKRCQSLGVFCEAYGVEGSGLQTIPKGQRIDDIVMKVFYKSWKLPVPGEKTPATK